MLSQEKMNRINALAKLKREGKLTDSQAKERAQLHQEYLGAFREHMRQRLDTIEFVDEDGNAIDKSRFSRKS